MKKDLHKFIFMIMLFLCCSRSFAIPVYAMNTFFSTTPINKDEEELYSMFQIERVDEEYIGSSGICNFDINRNGDIAINFTKNYINIYDTHGNFLYGYRFQVKGAHYAFFDTVDSQIIFYFLRDNCLVKVDDQGALIEICGVYDYSENSDILDTQLQMKSRYYQGYEYRLVNAFIDSKYIRFGDTKLIRYSSDGEELVVYDGNKRYIAHCIVIASVIWLLFIIICFSNIILQRKQYKN